MAIGQTASIDTRNGIVPGRVVRIDPAAQEGTVIVDVALDGALPPGARPDLSVDGTIEIERLADVLYVGRPAYGQPNSKVGLFKLVDGRQGGGAGAGPARPQLGQHRRDRQRPAARRPGDPLRHLGRRTATTDLRLN